MFHNASREALHMAREQRHRVYCPGELAEMKRKHKSPESVDQATQMPERKVVAHVCLSLYDDGECAVSTSESATNCDSGPITESMKQQLVNEHRDYELRSGGRHCKLEAPDHLWHSYPTERRMIPMFTPCDSKERVSSPEVTKRSQDGSHSASSKDTATETPSEATVIRYSVKKHESLDVYDDQPSEDECRAVVVEGKVNSIMIEDTNKVVEHMTTILKNMQQTAVKRLAKAWIKGICPKKQAKFPYHNCKVLPKWWPDVSVCPFTEPDHIRKEQRLQLCLHLLRLRPDPNDLQAWNDNDNAPHKSHILKGWTEFLREVAPPEVLMDVRQTDADNTSKRYNHLASLYDIARLEEAYMNDETDGTTLFQWSEPVSTRKKVKTSSKPVVAIKRPVEEADDAHESEHERPDRKRSRMKHAAKASRNATCSKAENNKLVSTKPSAQTSTLPHTTMPIAHGSPRQRKNAAFNASTSDNAPTMLQLDIQPYQYVNGCRPEVDSYTTRAMTMEAYKPLLSAPVEGCLSKESFDSSFSSNYSSMYHMSNSSGFASDTTHGALSSANNIHHALACLDFKHEPEPQLCMNASDIPQPYFATVPNSPILPQSGDLSSSLHHSFHSMPISSATYPTWSLSTRYPSSFVCGTASYDGVSHPLLSRGVSHDGVASMYDGIRTLANSPIQMSPTEQAGPRTASEHTSFCSSHF